MKTVRIERLGHLGDGIAMGPVFVRGALPGETVSGLPKGDRLTSPKIVEPSAERVSAQCRHARSCGGCTFQHATDSFVAGWKTEIVETALRSQGLPSPIRNTLTSPIRSRRRAVFSARRTKKGALVGFHAHASDVIIDTPDCILVEPALSQAFPLLRELTVTGASRKGELSFVVTNSANGLDIAATGGKELEPTDIQTIANIATGYPLARLSWNHETLLLNAPAVQKFGDADVIPPSGAFLQATVSGQNALLSGVLETISSSKSVVDLFAGCGTFSLPIASVAQVHAVEGDADMISALDHAWRTATGLKAVTTEVRDLFRRPLLADELSQFDAAVVDPPRAGAEQQVTQFAESHLAAISMVSCNPVTLARDAKIMVEFGYQLDWLDVIDQFRWSPHVELVAQFTRK